MASAQAWWQRALLRPVQGFRAYHSKKLQAHGLQRRLVTTAQGATEVYVSAQRGPGPAWVIIHGFSSEVLDWELALPLLLAHCSQIIAVNLPGHGGSAWMQTSELSISCCLQAVKDALLQVLAPEHSCVLVGNSLGGLLAVRLAEALEARQSPKVEGLVLISPLGAPYTAAEHAAIRRVLSISSSEEARVFTDMVLAPGAFGAIRPLFGWCAWAHLNKPQLLQLKQCFATEPPLSPHLLATLPAVLLVWGERDEVLPVSGRHYFTEHLAPGRTRAIADRVFNHTPFMDHPLELVEQIKLWAPGGRPPSAG